MSVHRRFKTVERGIAKYLGGQRVGHLGGHDVDCGWLRVEVKTRKTLPAWVLDALTQAEGHGADGVLSAVVLHQERMEYGDALICMRLSDFRDWFGDGLAQLGGAMDGASDDDLSILAPDRTGVQK